MISTKLNFPGLDFEVTNIIRPKSVWVKDLNAKVGDRLNIGCILYYTRKYATYLIVTNMSDPKRPEVAITQEQFFNQFAGQVNGAFDLTELN